MSVDLAFLQYPQQSVPVLDDKGLFVRAWFMVFNSIQSNFAEVVRRLEAIMGLIPLKMVDATQSQLTTVKGDLSVGQLVNVTDYAHVLKWTGSAYTWGPGELGSGMFQLFEVDPTGPGWHLYDGTANVPYLKSDGTLGTKTLPDLVSSGAVAAYPKAGSPDSGPNAATAPTFTGGSIAAAATGISASTSVSGSAVNVLASSVTSVSLAGHTHAVNVTDPTHTHTIGSSSVGTDGEPRNLVRRPWFRQ